MINAHITQLAIMMLMSVATTMVRADTPLGLGFEPTIAINPLNPDNIAIASWNRARVSTDGGQTWSAEAHAIAPSGYGNPTPPPGFPPYIPGGDPCLTFDSTGRLFWVYIIRLIGSTNGVDIFLIELNPATGSIVSGPRFVTTTGGTANRFNDKPWIVADANPDSLFADRLYVAWTRFDVVPNSIPPRGVLASYSTDHGLTWSTPVALSPFDDGEGYPWPTHAAVAPNGDVYVAYHSQFFAGGVPNGTSGRVRVRRSVDGGVTYLPATSAFDFGQADITFNFQHLGGTIPQAAFRVQGCQAWVMPDPTMVGRIYVVVADDPDNVHGSGDESDVMMARSDDHGQTWSVPTLVSDGPGISFQVLPAAAIDPVTGCIGVAWYDNRAGLVNANNNFLLDFRYAISSDGGVTFSRSVALNDQPFDPDLQGFHTNTGPPTTYWIGEYFGVAMGGGHLAAVWTGNSDIGDQTIFDRVPACPICAPADITCDGVVNVLDLLAVINAWGPCPAPPANCDADIAPAPNGDGVVNVLDLLMVINNWG